jgi:hypothetical protein
VLIGDSGHGIAKLGRKLEQRNERKRPLAQASMRDFELGSCDRLVVKEQDVNVNDARTPAPRRAAPDLLLGRFQQRKQRGGVERRCYFKSSVEKRILVGIAPGRRFVKLRLAENRDAGSASDKRDCAAQVLRAIARV